MNVLSLAAPERGFFRQSWPLAALVMLCLTVAGPLSAQNNTDPPTLNNVVIPPSPDAAALGEYAEVPVGLYTGVPQVSVPIWNLQGRRLSVPISLSYHASGIKVDEIASRIGLGWALQAGGTISRSINGKPDEIPTGYFATAPLMPTPSNLGADQVDSSTYGNAGYQMISAMAEGSWDGTPDIYNLNFPGGTAQLFFDSDKEAHLIPFGIMDVDRDWVNDNWVISTADGVKYFFGGQSASEESITTFSGGQVPTLSAVTAWHLTRIEDPAGDIIEFIYEEELSPACQPLPESETVYRMFISEAGCEEPDDSRSWGTTCTRAMRIKEIVSSRGKVKFHYSSTHRTDQNGSQALEEIEVLTVHNQTLKKFDLLHSSWAGRLMLDEVVEFAGCQAKPSHKFEYNKSYLLPQPGSKRIDHWGYYNGKHNNSLVPRYYFSDCFSIGNANREPDFTYGSVGVLEKLTYPAGGTTEFEYEPHTIWTGPGDPERIPQVAVAEAGCSGNSGVCNPVANPESNKTTRFNVNHGQCATVTLHFSNPGGAGSCGSNVKIWRVAGNQLIKEWVCGIDAPGSKMVFLAPGSYDLEVTAHYGGDTVAAVIDHWFRIGAGYNKEIGGIRVKRISDFDGESPSEPMVREFIYEKEGLPGQSSGLLVRHPNYLFEQTQLVPRNDYSDGTGSSAFVSTCRIRGAHSAARGLNGNSGGTHIGYGEVRTLHGLNGSNGYTTSTFTTSLDYPEPASEWPYGPDMSRSHLRGLPLTTSVYSAAGKPMSSTVIDYTFRNENYTQILGYSAAFSRWSLDNVCSGCDTLVYRVYPIRSEWFYAANNTTRQYDPNGIDFSESVTSYEYDNPVHSQVTATKSMDSEGRELISRTTYPDDISIGQGNDPYAVAITHLKNKFMKSTPIESTVWQKKPSQQEELLQGSLTRFKVVNPNMVMPTEVWTLETNDPSAAFTPVNCTNGIFEQDSRYRLLETVERYDTFGNLLQVKKEGGARVSFKWGYDRTLPVAQVIDATTPYSPSPGSNWVLNGETACTGFESGLEDDHNAEEDFWSFQGANFHINEPHTGKMARRIIAGASQYGPIRELRPQDQNTRYVFSAWVKTPSNYAGGKLTFRSKLDDPNNNSTYPNPGMAPSYQQVSIPPTNGKWRLIEVKLDLIAIREAINLPTSVVLRIAASIQNNDPNNSLDIDDLRILPERARMTTYSYEPMVGQLATLDINNRASSFQYDDLWRLKEVLDHNRYIRKRTSYAYARREAHVKSDATGDKAYVGNVVNFSSTTSLHCSEGATYSWDFGDGLSFAGGPNCTHSWSSPGSYQVALTIQQGGQTTIANYNITILN